MTQRPELLAPAGSWEALVAAVQNGADAVYLGGKLFNARHSASNFDNQQLARAVEYAHIRGVKIYVTVNILIANHELEEALGFLHFLHNIGVDAAILQDLGLAKLAKETIPELTIHASTQMTVHNTAGVQLMQQSGFDRIVLAREMELEEIAAIKRETGADLEAFIHGALCVCYSGQCLMSSMIGGRSGNRGKCAQPCRLQYQLVDERGRNLADPAQVGEYLLSPRDINTSAQIPRLMAAGINSFKIEGRMKRPEYVATVIRTYRNLIDRALADNEGFFVQENESRELAQIFNRDFSPGYFLGNPGKDLMSYKRPNNRGVRLGRVKGFNAKHKTLEILLEEPLRLGDGIEVWVSEGGRTGIEVSSMLVYGKPAEYAEAGTLVGLAIPGKIRPGDRVFKTHDAALMERARETFTSSRETKKIPLEFFVRAKIDEPMYMRVTDDTGLTAEGHSDEVGQEAVKRPLTRDFLQEQLDRLGNTPFALGELQVDLQGNVILPMREINELRRSVLADLEQKRARHQRRSGVAEHIFRERLQYSLGELATMAEPKQTQPKLAVNVTDFTSLEAAVSYGANIVYFGGESYRSKGILKQKELEAGLEFCQKNGVALVLNSPRILHDQELKAFTSLLEGVKELPLDGILVGNLGLLKLLKDYSDKPVIGDFTLNVFNSATLHYLKEQGVERAVLSPELTMRQIQELAGTTPMPLEAIVQGALPLMNTKYCPVGSILGGLSTGKRCSGPCHSKTCGLKDRMGLVFPLEVDQYCRMHLFNAKELCVIEDVPTLLEAGISVLRVEAKNNDHGYVAKTVNYYHKAINRYQHGIRDERKDKEAKEDLAGISTAGITKGHYYRGVL
ncbi:DUF3656 domain-containing U32 family peptidase [Desulforamulus aeronauticus]|uniref:Putative protease n=1 Tax=Desulforamulus aeronauticus DSM 10349 TaxID=1121421 RepID=A0A1M6P3T3_9FIRM|nr:DUF3656 domain-containing protein [Desulforamulus aeronauticus]SHK02637.1 putative protease [Desulforamulus aeronauticus DSM 10349]